MKRMTAALLFVSTLPVACMQDQGPPLEVTDIRVLAPLPGRTTSVAYLTIHNRSNKRVSIDRITSPAFAKVEIHETTISDGVARMQHLESIEIGADSKMEFAPGGKHIMLVDPQKGLLPGGKVRLELQYDGGGLLILEAPVMTRLEDPT